MKDLLGGLINRLLLPRLELPMLKRIGAEADGRSRKQEGDEEAE